MNTSSSSSKSSSSSGRSFPLGKVKGQFEDKAKLVSAVQALATPALWLDRAHPERPWPWYVKDGEEANPS